MNPTDLAQMLELMAAALRTMQAAPGTPGAPVAGMSPPAPAVPQRTLSAWLDIHEQQILGKGYKLQTIRNRLGNLKHVRRLWGARPIEALRAHEISAALRTEFLPAKSATAQRVLAELRDSINEAIANDWATSNPASHVKMPANRVKRKRLSFETWQQMRELAKASRQRWLESLLLLSLTTGQRRGDLAKMRFNDVVDGHLQIEQQKQAGKWKDFPRYGVAKKGMIGLQDHGNKVYFRNIKIRPLPSTK